MVPTAVGMAFELATYGTIAGLLYYALKKTKFRTYISLIGAMIAGRIVWGIASVVIYQIMGAAFTWQMFAAGAFITAIPGILVQLVIIPPIVTVLRKNEFIE